MIGCLRRHVHKQPIIALYFEFENDLKFDDLGARTDLSLGSVVLYSGVLITHRQCGRLHDSDCSLITLLRHRIDFMRTTYSIRELCLYHSLIKHGMTRNQTRASGVVC